ncbi:hypothetical protein H8959_018122 [Pygathrix nigripes]
MRMRRRITEDEEEEEDEEGLGPPGPANLGTTALFPRKAQPAQAFRGDGIPRALGGQERLGPGPAQTGGAHVAPQLQPPDHGDWTYEEQFKQSVLRESEVDLTLDTCTAQTAAASKAQSRRGSFGVTSPDQAGTRGQAP